MKKKKKSIVNDNHSVKALENEVFSFMRKKIAFLILCDTFCRMRRG